MLVFKRIWVLVFIFQAVLAQSATRIESKKYAEFADQAHRLAAQYGAAHVLLVSDIDNTLLAMNQELGSDQWYSWQEGEVAKGTSLAVAKDLAGLLSIQNLLYHMGSAHVVEPTIPGLFSELQAEGFPDLALTSRGPDMRNLTEQELDKNGIHLDRAALGGKGFAGNYLPYQLENPEASGISSEELRAFKAGSPRPVSYMNGIYMTAGQHKGLMLRVLLAKVPNDISAIVFIDDYLKHVERMEAAFEHQPQALVTIRYGAEDEKVAAFKAKDKSEVTSLWREINELLGRVFNKSSL